MAIPHTVTVLEQISVAPPLPAAAEISLPLTFLDLLWLHWSPVQRLIFYQHPISTTHFIDTIIPKMRNSLSQSLQHYSPLAGRVIVSPDSSIQPEARYVAGDTVPLLFGVSNSSDFNHLTSDHARSCTDFRPLVPILPPTSRASDGSITVPVFALQVTLFPDVGICVGVTNHHAIGDASAVFGFMKAWTFFSAQLNHENSTSSPASLPSENRPFYDRTVLKDRKGLTAFFWDVVKNTKIEDTHNVNRLPPVTDKVRSSFLVTREDIQRLKNHVQARRPNQVHVSSFTVICGYVWSCLVRSRNQTAADTNNQEGDDEFFICAADCRARLDPPVPRNYFGNCVTGCIQSARTDKLMGDDEGVVNAAEVIGESIRKQLYNKDDDGVFIGAEDWFKVMSRVKADRSLGVAGSPKFDYYGLDFGWGKPKKFEIPSIDITGAISLSTAKGYEAGLEVGISLPVPQMDKFTTVFGEGLKSL